MRDFEFSIKPICLGFKALLGWLALAALVLGLKAASSAQEAPPLALDCPYRPTKVRFPMHDFRTYCLELVVDAERSMAFVGLSVDDAGRLYATRPDAGALYTFDDGDGDGLPETPRLLAEGFDQPFGLSYHAGALYVSGGRHIERFSLTGERATLVDDVPSGGGFATGDLVIGPDERLYVGTGAPCDACFADDPLRGAILSYDLRGGDRQIVARGLRHPAGLAFHQGDLWVVDSVREGLSAEGLDELNRISFSDARENVLHFGWPYCIGERQPDPLWNADGAFDCAATRAPVARFEARSAPHGLASYRGPAFPQWEGDLLVALSGSTHRPDLRGYALVGVDLGDGPDTVEHIQAIAPFNAFQPFQAEVPYSARAGYISLLSFNLNRDGAGFYPHRPLDVAVTPWGWAYLSVSDGRILVVRPAEASPDAP